MPGNAIGTKSFRILKNSTPALFASLLLCSSACDEENMSRIQSEQLQAGADAENFLQGAQRNEDGWIMVDRDDLYAYSPPDVVPFKNVYYEIWDLFSEVNPKYDGNKMTVVYLGSLEPELRPDGSIFGYRFPMLANNEYFAGQSEFTGTGVMWASLATQSLYYINYPNLPEEEIFGVRPVTRMADSGPTVNTAPFVQQVSKRYEGPSFLETYGGAQLRGVVREPDNRHQIFGENSPVSGKMFQRMLSVGSASGSLIGPRHGLTAAHVVVDVDDTSNTLLVDHKTVRAGRNGDTQIGEDTTFRHLYWHADWTPELNGVDYRALDFAWGVLEEPVGKLTGYFGYAWDSLQEIQEDGYTLRNLGYPSCDHAPVPNECIDHHLYMDSNSCETGSVQSPDFQGSMRTVQHACDTSPGHSGSPLILTEAGSLYVWAVHVSAAGSWNRAARVTPHRSVDLISDMYRNFPRD